MLIGVSKTDQDSGSDHSDYTNLFFFFYITGQSAQDWNLQLEDLSSLDENLSKKERLTLAPLPAPPYLVIAMVPLRSTVLFSSS